jgi:hypothetical protein
MSTAPPSKPLDPSTIINVFVHGFFFMRLGSDSKTIELIVPPVPSKPEHKFVGGIRGQLQPLTRPVTDWTHIGLDGTTTTQPDPGNIPVEVVSTIPQFSLTTTGIADFDESTFDARVILPWPKKFLSVRCDSLDNAFLFNKRRPIVGPEIKRRCGTKVGFITCLQYTSANGVTVFGSTVPPQTNLHVYFEPCQKHKIKEVNNDLTKAQDIFFVSAKFDLKMKRRGDKLPSTPASPVGLCSDPDGFQRGDDLSLCEDTLARVGVCVKALRIENANPSNCPNFFVGP